MLVNLTNDGYFGTTAAREQHMISSHACRRKPPLDCSLHKRRTNRLRRSRRQSTANTGPRIETSGRLGFSYIVETTAYSRYGDVFAWTCLVIAVGFLILSQIQF